MNKQNCKGNKTKQNKRRREESGEEKRKEKKKEKKREKKRKEKEREQQQQPSKTESLCIILEKHFRINNLTINCKFKIVK